MKNYLAVLVALTFALPSSSLFIILPLYLYPGESASAWSSVTSTIEAYPGIQWQVVVNPNSGPGTKSMPTDTNFIDGIAKLNSYPNVMTVGYVLTGYGTRPQSEVTADVDVYASWSDYNNANISIGGIYFDEVSSEETSSMYGYYDALASHARSSMPSQTTRVVFNPGTVAPTQLFSYCDTMVEFEASFSDYGGGEVIQKIPSGYRKQSAVQIYSTPETADVGGLVQKMAQAGVEAVFFGLDCCYKEWSATLLKNMAEAVSNGDGETCSEL